MNTVLTAAANDPAPPQLVLPGKSLPASAAFSWIAQGWALFRKAALMWVVLTVLILIAAIVVSMIPFLGTVAWQVMTALIAGGLVLGCWSLEEDGELELDHLFAGFKRNFRGLALVGVAYLVGVVIILAVFSIFVGLSVLPALLMGNSEAAVAAFATMSGGLLVGTLVITVLSIALGAAMWFAPALVIMHNAAPMEALKASFFAVLRNFVPALIFAIVMFLLAIVASIPFGLGMLVWVPVLITASYRAYRQIFTA
jgi:uncharacterized membrane protein